MLIAIAIIAILASVAIPQYGQYKIRGYDAQAKQALKNMHLLCNAYWLDTSALQGCDLSKIKEPTYGFNQNADVAATLPPSPRDNFCASAKHNDSPNTFSIDSAALISSGSTCAGSSVTVQTASAGGSVKTAPVREPLKLENWECVSDGNGPWTKINSPGNELDGWCVRMFLFPGEDNPRYSFVAPDGAPYNYGNAMPPVYPNGYLAAAKQFAAEGNEIIAFDYPGGFREPASFYTATLDDQGKMIEVDDSREVTFSEWNSKSLEERKELTSKARMQDSTFCDHQRRTLPPAFFANYEPCQF